MKLDQVTSKKQELDRHRSSGGLPPELVKNLDDWFRVELTYTSNAIEGNTLTRQETALVVEKGLTVGGKTLREHLEASNHVQALDWVTGLAKQKSERLSEKEIRELHSLILRGIDDTNAGRFREIAVRISGSRVVLPNPIKVPELMENFVNWLNGSVDQHPVERAAEVHYRLVTIHPFVDGNGRTARLLMNLILLQHGHPPALIEPMERLEYISSLEKSQLGGSKDDFESIIVNAVNRSLDIYLKAITGVSAQAPEAVVDKLLKIGELAKAVGETVPTIRFWTKEGLLDIAGKTSSNYSLYSSKDIQLIKRIQALKQQRYTIREIRELLKG